jgi:hypothetical protein
MCEKFFAVYIQPEFKDFCGGWAQGYSDIVVDELDYLFSLMGVIKISIITGVHLRIVL